MRDWRPRCAAAALAALAGGCHPRPIDFGPRGRLTDPQIAVNVVIERRERTRTVRGDASVDVDSPRGHGRVEELVAAEWPNHIRLESLSAFGSPLAVMTSDGFEFAMNDMTDRQFETGAATPENISRMLPIQLRAEDVVALLLGVPPVIPSLRSTELILDERERSYALLIGDGAAAEAIGLDPATLRPVWVRMNAAAAPTPFEARFREYDPDTDLPRVVEVTTHRPDARVVLKWRDREVNATLPESTFTQPVPSGMRPAGQ